MPVAEAVAIAEAVVTVLNGATLSQSFTAVRSYAPYSDTTTLSTLSVKVVNRDWVPTPVARKMTDNEFGIDIGVQKRSATGLVTDADICAFCDPLMYLVQQIVDLFQFEGLSGYATASCMVTTNTPIFDPEQLREHRVFTSVIQLGFKETRSIP